MSRLSLFNSPFLLGFDEFERRLERLGKTGGDSYPPYNIEQIGENRLRIVLAIAGFGIDDLDIEIEDNQLCVRGRQKEDGEKVYLYRGIAARQFQRSFVLAEGIEVAGATLDNGLLVIDLVRPRAETLVKKVPIRQNGAAKPGPHTPKSEAREGATAQSMGGQSMGGRTQIAIDTGAPAFGQGG